MMLKRAPVPRGGGLFGDAPLEPQKHVAAYHANIDGGSRGNPGPAAYGVVIRDGSGAIVARGMELPQTQSAHDFDAHYRSYHCPSTKCRRARRKSLRSRWWRLRRAANRAWLAGSRGRSRDLSRWTSAACRNRPSRCASTASTLRSPVVPGPLARMLFRRAATHLQPSKLAANPYSSNRQNTIK